MVTRKQVAERAGVSEAVVSYVMNGRKLVKEATRRKVLDAVQELGYRPNQTARSLKTKRTRQLLVLVHFLGNPFEAGLLLHMEAQAKERGYTLFIHTLGGDEEEELKDLLMGRADGLMLFGQHLSAGSLAYCRSIGLPVASITRPGGGGEALLPYVDIDWVSGYRRLVRHLRDHDHEHIAFMTNGLPDSPIAYRLESFREAMRLEGLDLPEERVLEGHGRFEHAAKRCEQALREGRSFTAIVGGNDLMAAGCLSACRSVGLAVPGEIAVAGSEDILMSSQTAPPLTTLHYPRPQAGKLGMDLLLGLIEEETQGGARIDEEGKDLKPKRILLETELIVREST